MQSQRVMRDAELRGALRLELGELAEVVAEALRAAAVEAGPERRLADRARSRPWAIARSRR